MANPPDDENMGKEDRQRVVLSFMSQYDLALPPKAIFRNLRYKWYATFGYTTLQNYLDEFEDDGLVRRIDPKALEKRDVKDASESNDIRAYYLITDKGREFADGSEQ